MKERIKQMLNSRRRIEIMDPTRAKSAVLIPVYSSNGSCRIVFIQRSPNVRTHRGQMAFPGGMYEPKDVTLLNTALRESFEEIGLRAEDVEILGQLDDHISMTSNFIMTPFVGVVPWPYRFTVDGRETVDVIDSPISALARQGHLHEDILIQEAQVTTSYYFHCGPKIIWGATARILNQFLGIVIEAAGGLNKLM